MVLLRYTTAIGRADLMRDCLAQIRQWPGCETVKEIEIIGDSKGSFAVQIVDYGHSRKRYADRAMLCIQRETQRRYHMKTEEPQPRTVT
jgi:hypothetical protein